MTPELSRRRLLTLVLAGGVATLLSACAGAGSASQGIEPIRDQGQPSAVPPPATATPTAVPPTPTVTPTPKPRGPLLTNPRFRQQGTPATNSLGPDGYTWAQGNPLIVDRTGGIIALAQKVARKDDILIFFSVFVYSNDAGRTWRESSLEITGVSRASLAYDADNDIVHALWRGQNIAEGVSYRRYTIERDGAQQIVGFSADPRANVTLDGQLGDGQMTYEHPIITWLAGAEIGNRYGAVLCVWSARNKTVGSAGNEVRATYCPLSNSADDALLTNWAAPGESAATTIGNPPKVAYSALAANRAPDMIYPSLGRTRGPQHRGDLYLFYADGGGGEGGAARWCWRRFPWRENALRWAAGMPEATITPIRRAGTDRGYEAKGQLGTKVVEDPRTGRVYFGFTTWKDDAAGDTWNFSYVDGDDKLGPLVDVYSSNGRFQPELYALTGDLVFDEQSKRLVVSYIHTGVGSNLGCLRVYDGALPVEAESQFFTAADVDIPLLWQEPRTGICRFGRGTTEQLLVLFRDTNGQIAPYRGWFGTLDWRAEG